MLQLESLSRPRCSVSDHVQRDGHYCELKPGPWPEAEASKNTTKGFILHLIPLTRRLLHRHLPKTLDQSDSSIQPNSGLTLGRIIDPWTNATVLINIFIPKHLCFRSCSWSNKSSDDDIICAQAFAGNKHRPLVDGVLQRITGLTSSTLTTEQMTRTRRLYDH